MRTKRAALILAAVTTGALALVAPPAQASHSWSNYHWARTSNPFTLQVGNNTTLTASLTTSWPDLYTTAANDWSTSAVMDLATTVGTSSKRCAMKSGTVQVCNNTYGANGWLGLASIYISGSHITQGSAKMNDTYFNTSTYNNPNEKLHVMCQEVGHTFGLDHQSTDGSSQNTCMDYFSNTGANATSTLSTHPNAHDYDQLVTIYTHGDSSTTLAAAPAAAGSRNEVGNDRSTWGIEVERGVHGEFSIFVRDFGHDQKVITHVTWATR